MSDLLGFTTPAVERTTSDRAWLGAMLEVEAALARAASKVGLVPHEAAEAIAVACATDGYDIDSIAARARESATPIVPLVDDLRAAVPTTVRPYVHFGATSQDIMDTAMCLVAARTIDVILADAAATAAALAKLARTHRRTPQIGRTLLQHAAPTTFGLVCAIWLTEVDEAVTDVIRARRDRLAVQLGGPVGTLSSLNGHGLEITGLLAAELGLATPTAPWHTARGRIGDVAAALGGLAGAFATIALDVALLAQSEIAEVAEGHPGGSSSMPHKRNPARSVMVTATTHRAPGLVATLLSAAPQELQRATGRWQSEWPTLTELLRVTGSAASHARAMLTDLRVDGDRMRANLDAALAGIEHMSAVTPDGSGAAIQGAAAETSDAHRAAIQRASGAAIDGASGAAIDGASGAAIDGASGAADDWIARALAAHERQH